MNRSISFNCWKCGVSVLEVPIPLPRAEMCPKCNADLHACKQCEFYDTAKASACREPIADHVSDKTRANFCGYLSIKIDPHQVNELDNSDADALGALFGVDNALDSVSPATSDKAQGALEDLFGLAPKDAD